MKAAGLEVVEVAHPGRVGQRDGEEKLTMYHFFVSPDQIGKDQIEIIGTDVNHIRNVLRMAPGEEITVSTGSDEQEYRCAIRTLEEDRIVADIRWCEAAGRELPAKLYLFQGLPKADKMEFIIQKAVELGVHQIIPVSTKRAVVKLDAKKEASKLKRWNAIAESAAKQSKRQIIPEVSPVMSFKEAAAFAEALDHRLIPYERAEGMAYTRACLQAVRPGDSVGIFIGPEGGFEQEEIELARSHGIQAITLGKRILRTETAGSGAGLRADVPAGGIIMEAYLDNSATTRCSDGVCEIVMKTMKTDFGNPSSRHMKGVEAERYLRPMPARVASTLKVKEKEIYFTSGGTESNNWAVIGGAMANRRAGKHLITTAVEHAAVIRPMLYLEEQGFRVTYLPVDEKGTSAWIICAGALQRYDSGFDYVCQQ